MIDLTLSARRLALLGAALLVGSACGSLVTAGEACTTRADCPPSYSCFVKGTNSAIEIPGGFCSRACTAEAQTYECPGGTICTYFGDTNLICSPTCNTSAQCREGYECADLPAATGNTSGAKKSCRPKNVTAR